MSGCLRALPAQGHEQRSPPSRHLKAPGTPAGRPRGARLAAESGPGVGLTSAVCGPRRPCGPSPSGAGVRACGPRGAFPRNGIWGHLVSGPTAQPPTARPQPGTAARCRFASGSPSRLPAFGVLRALRRLWPPSLASDTPGSPPTSRFNFIFDYPLWFGSFDTANASPLGLQEVFKGF